PSRLDDGDWRKLRSSRVETVTDGSFEVRGSRTMVTGEVRHWRRLRNGRTGLGVASEGTAETEAGRTEVAVWVVRVVWRCGFADCEGGEFVRMGNWELDLGI
ncbi:hypothetical protein PIB30_068266, partial [Stylosanthes scabra]|nr:hypothetical protein [Stylosanthes scabra]